MQLIKRSVVIALFVTIALVTIGIPQSNVEAQGFTPRISITGAPIIDVCNSTSFFLPIDVDFDAQTRSYGDDMQVPGSGQVSNFQSIFTGPASGPSVYGFNPTPYSVAPNTIVEITIYTYYDTAWTNLSWVSEIHFNCTTGAITFQYDGPPVVANAQPAPQVGMISISAGQAQPVYESAGGNIVKDGGGNELWLPNDADGSGSDTYLIMDSVEIDGRTWYEIWLGDASSTVWVPADTVTAIQ